MSFTSYFALLYIFSELVIGEAVGPLASREEGIVTGEI